MNYDMLKKYLFEQVILCPICKNIFDVEEFYNTHKCKSCDKILYLDNDWHGSLILYYYEDNNRGPHNDGLDITFRSISELEW